jgi:putative DNA primase/helicase
LISDRHPTDLAGLRGARLVTATETEEGRRWAESRIKQLPGGDTIAARFMRQDFFEYRPQFKLFIAGNHKPSLRSVDEAIRRRFHLVPFAVTIPPEERDGELAEKLKNEWPGILAWMIEGSLGWQTDGLHQPEAVSTATEAYLSAEVTIAAWLDEGCDRARRCSRNNPAPLVFIGWRARGLCRPVDASRPFRPAAGFRGRGAIFIHASANLRKRSSCLALSGSKMEASSTAKPAC